MGIIHGPVVTNGRAGAVNFIKITIYNRPIDGQIDSRQERSLMPLTEIKVMILKVEARSRIQRVKETQARIRTNRRPREWAQGEIETEKNPVI